MKTIMMLLCLANAIFNVSGEINLLTDEANSEISFSRSEWDGLMKGTRFCGDALYSKKRIPIYIEIADQRNGKCNRGIGLGCSIMERKEVSNAAIEETHHFQRMAMAEIVNDSSGIVTLKFISKINWLSLAMNR